MSSFQGKHFRERNKCFTLLTVWCAGLFLTLKSGIMNDKLKIRRKLNLFLFFTNPLREFMILVCFSRKKKIENFDNVVRTICIHISSFVVSEVGKFWQCLMFRWMIFADWISRCRNPTRLYSWGYKLRCHCK